MSDNPFTRIRKALIGFLCALTAILLASFALAEKPTTTDRPFIEMQTSINSMMVAMVDWSAHEVWEAGYAETMTGRNWLTVRQYATELLAAGTLVSLGGTGRADQQWVRDPEWQNWTSMMIEETREALRAIDARDQEKLVASGERLVEVCEGCHAAFKPAIPTEGIMHVPHHEYGDPLSRE